MLEPGGQPNPNDRGGVPDKNLSDDYDCYKNRQFTVMNGEVSFYGGYACGGSYPFQSPHWLDSGKNEPGPGDPKPNGLPPYIRLFPYSDTTNHGGVYIMAICYIGDGSAYPVEPRDCKYDAFKVKQITKLRWITCRASGVIGWGIPGAMAVRSLYPEEPILVLSGDGSATFTIAELETATRQGLPFVCVIADDRAWGIVVSNMRKMGKPMVGAKLGPIRFDQVAQGFGACGLRIEDPRELPQAIREGFRADRPTLIHVPIKTGGPSD